MSNQTKKAQTYCISKILDAFRANTLSTETERTFIFLTNKNELCFCYAETFLFSLFFPPVSFTSILDVYSTNAMPTIEICTKFFFSP